MSEKEGRNICEQRYSDIDWQAGRHDTKQAIKKTDRLWGDSSLSIIKVKVKIPKIKPALRTVLGGYGWILF